MKTLFLLCLWTALAGQAWSACGSGTLQCQTDNVPSVCDFTQNYVLSGSSCEVKKVEGCEIASFDDSNKPCFLCEKGKVLDENSTVCVDVDSEKAVTNCFRYDKSSSDCVECETDFFLSGSSCVAVGNIKVDNCTVYSSITQCKTCDAGYYLSGNECVNIEALPNCRLHSNRKCSDCEAGYHYNLAFNSNPLVANSAAFELFAGGGYSEVAIDLSSNTTTVCEKITVLHCAKLETAATCAECTEGYFLTSQKTCQRYPEPTVPDCVVYSSASKCKKCADTHYLVDGNPAFSQQCKLIPQVAECSNYNKDNGFCTACNEGFWLNKEQNSCVARKFNPPLGCQTPNSLADECSTCKDNFTMVGDKTGCFQNISNCQDQEKAENVEADGHVCNECNSDYFPEGGACKLRTIANCHTYMKHKNACERCEYTHYISDAKDSCTKKQIDFCVEYTDNDDKNTCTKCQNLKFVANGGAECSDIAHLTDCKFSDGVNDQCAACNAGVLNTVGGCSGARTETYYDSNCDANSSATDDSSCYKCKSGFVETVVDSNYIRPAKTEAEMETLKCLEMDQTSTKCKQCRDGHYLNPDNSGTCVENLDQSAVCKRIKPTFTNTLANPSQNCEECYGEKGYYFDGVNDNCTEVDKMSALLDCEKIGPTENNCILCKSDTYLVEINEGKLICAKESISPSKFTNVNDCAVAKDLDKCLICKAGKMLNQTKDACTDVPANMYILKNALNLEMNQIGDIAIDDKITDCEEYIQTYPGYGNCSKCKPGFVGIIDNLNLMEQAFGSPAGNELFNSYKKCIDDANAYQTAGGVAHVAEGECLVGFSTNDETDSYGCLRCSAGKIGVAVEVSKTHTGADMSSSAVAVGSCATAATELQKSFIGINYFGRVAIGTPLSSNYMAYTDCTDSNKVIFYMLKYQYQSGIELNESKNGSIPNPLAWCGTEADTISDTNDIVPNCAIYAFKDAVPASFNQATDKIPKAVCRACKPGFYMADYDTNGGILDCVVIHSCNSNNGNNTWLNACENPDSGGWKTHFPNRLIDNYIAFHDPMPNYAPYKIENCLVLRQTQLKCLVCKPGFQSTGSACVEVTSENSNCKTKGIGETLLDYNPDWITQSEESKMFSQYRYIRKHIDAAKAYKDFSNSFCGECDTGARLTGSTGSNTVCGIKVKRVSEWDHCVEFGQGKCKSCEAGYVYHEDEGICVSNSADVNCKTTRIAGCKTCKEGYTLFNGTCTQNFCAETSCGACLRCEAGKAVVDANSGICGDNPDSNDPCEFYSPMLNGMCVKCKDSGKMPYIYKYQNTYTFNHWSCETFTPPANGWTNLNMEYPYVEIHKSSTSLPTVTLKELRTLSRIVREYSTGVEGQPADVVCVPSRTVENCQEGRLDKEIACTGCQQGKYLLKNNTCENSPVSQCLELESADTDKCTKCNDSYYLSADKRTCTQRQKSVNCSGRAISSDTCTSCAPKQFVMNSESVCVPYTAANCQTLHDTKDQCEICVPKAYMDLNDNNKCILSEDPQCEIMKEFENECKICANGYFLKTEGLKQTCIQVTAQNCETHETHDNKCKTCVSGFYLTQMQICEKNTEIDFCTTYSRDNNNCKTCQEGYYSYTGNPPECRKNPSGITHCVTYSDETTCASCASNDSGFYLSENACSPVSTSILKCKVYASDKTCSECEKDYFLTSSTKCDAYDGAVLGKCSEYESHEKCKSCIANHILNQETKRCEPSGIDHCVKATRGSPNLCEECESGKFLNSNKQTCMSPSVLIDNCQDYESQTICKKCAAGHLLSLDGSKCTDLGSKAGANCSVAAQTDKLQCDVCNFGFVKSEIGECVKISELNCAFMAGDKCGLCLPTMNMDSEGKCSNPDSTEEPTRPTSATVLGLFAHLLLVLFLTK